MSGALSIEPGQVHSKLFLMLLINSIGTLDMNEVDVNFVANSMFDLHLSSCSKEQRDKILTETKQHLNQLSMGFHKIVEDLENKIDFIDNQEQRIHNSTKQALGISIEQDSRVISFANQLKEDWYNQTSAGKALGVGRNTVASYIKRGIIREDRCGYNAISKQSVIDAFVHNLNKKKN